MTTDTTPAAIEALLQGAQWQEPENLRRYLFPTFAALSAELATARQERDDYREAYEDTKRLARLLDVAMNGEDGAAQQASLCDLVADAATLRKEVERLRGLTYYVLQDDLHNRLTPRMVDIAYSAFMLGRSGKNKDDGGPCDWFNDTKPMVMMQIAKISAALTAEPLGHGVTADDFGGEA